MKIQNLQNRYNLLIDTLEIRKKPNYSEEHLEGMYKGFEKSRLLFGEFVKELIKSYYLVSIGLFDYFEIFDLKALFLKDYFVYN